MNGYRFLSIVLGLFSFGAVRETYRILTSNDRDIADNRSSLIPIALAITIVLIFFMIRFWRKGAKE